jgi:D-3-phosphoglycerate dehydrogenase
VGLLAEFFGMRVVYFDVAAKLPLGNVKSEATLEAVLAQSDFVTLHVPETPQTKGMIGPKQLAAMKKGACLLNLSRGTVVDLEALAASLKSGHLAGASADVYPEEPEGNVNEGFKTPLQGLSNVILTPHIGGSTVEAQEAIGREVSASLIRYVRSGASTGSVNFPAVELAPTPGTSRVVHVHQNVPGVLRDVNRIVSEQGANIHAQVLSTTAELGYLIMDLDQPVAKPVCEAMQKLTTTLKARAL